MDGWGLLIVCSRITPGRCRHHRMIHPDVVEVPRLRSLRFRSPAGRGARWSPRSAARRTDLAAPTGQRPHSRRTRSEEPDFKDRAQPVTNTSCEFTGDCGVRQCRALTTNVEPDPTLMQSPVRSLSASPSRGTRLVPAAPQIRRGAIPGSVVPGGLDQQPPGVAVAGLGNRPLRPA